MKNNIAKQCKSNPKKFRVYLILFCLMSILLQGVININCINALSHMILESTFLLTERCLYGIVYLILLWILNLLIVLNVDWTNSGIIKMFYITGKTILLGPETEVLVYYKVPFNIS